MHRALARRRSDRESIRLAGDVGTPVCSPDYLHEAGPFDKDIAEHTKAPFWFQLYMLRDCGAMAR